MGRNFVPPFFAPDLFACEFFCTCVRGYVNRMDFRIADTFTDSLAHLTGDEQKVVKTTQEAYDTERHLLYVACTRARDALP